MFGSKKEVKQDLRDGMWERVPSTAELVEGSLNREIGPDIVSPDLHTQADGQTTHE